MRTNGVTGIPFFRKSYSKWIFRKEKTFRRCFVFDKMCLDTNINDNFAVHILDMVVCDTGFSLAYKVERQKCCIRVELVTRKDGKENRTYLGSVRPDGINEVEISIDTNRVKFTWLNQRDGVRTIKMREVCQKRFRHIHLIE